MPKGNIPYNPYANAVNNIGGTTAPIAPTYDPYKELYLNAQQPTSYQVKSGDTFQSIGAQLGLSESDLQKSANMTVPPPKGSYISLPRPGFDAAPQIKSTQKMLINQGVPASVAAQLAGAQYSSPTSPNLPQPGGAGANSFTSGVNVNMTEMTFAYQNQIANGVAPKSVPTQVLASLGATPQTMAENGYVLNSTNGMWELGGTGGAAQPPANQPDPYSEVRSVFYSRSRGWVTPEVANLLNRRRRRRQNQPKVVAAASATNAGTAPVTNLDVRIQSG